MKLGERMKKVGTVKERGKEEIVYWPGECDYK